MCQDPKVLARRRLADAKLPRNEHAADAVLDEVTVNLRWEVGTGLFQPIQDLQPPVARQSPQRLLHENWHIAN